jgi:hypothetical protein
METPAMAMSENDKIRMIREILADHKEHWTNLEPDMRRLRQVYLTKFYDDKTISDTSVRVETSDGYVFIESYIASLFEKSPSVEVDSMTTDSENVELARACSNNWLSENRKALENGSRLALIFPMSFFKIAPRQSRDPLSRVLIRAIEPWNIILDRDADLWEEQRFVGHHYYMTLSDARKQHGAKKYSPVSKPQYFEDGRTQEGSYNSLPESMQYIEVVEFYDLEEDMLYIFSPNIKMTGGFLEKSKIPLRNYDDSPLVPIAPLYYSRCPDKPMDGYSTLSRVYDQLFEKNIMRTFWANAVRRDSRQYLYKEGSIDEESLAKISAGLDGTMVPIDAESLDGVIRTVPVEPMSSNFERYLSAIESDIQRGSIVSPNVRGEATRSTATEITALAQYTASEIGRMARERDEAIEDIANIFVRMLVYTLDEVDRPVVMVDKKPRFVTSDALDHKFRYFALDQASTPLSKELKKRQLLELLPVLGQLGVPPQKLLEDIVREFGLNESYVEVVKEVSGSASKAGQAEMVSPEPTSSAERLAAELLGSQRGIPLPMP